MLDDSPGLEFIRKTIEPFGEIKRTFTVAAVNVETGEYETFNNDNITFEELAQAALSSGSIPTVFPPQHFHDMYLMDGGTVWNVNVQSAIEQCLEKVEDESDVYLDVMICDYTEEIGEDKSGNTVNNWFQARSIHHFFNDSNDVNE